MSVCVGMRPEGGRGKHRKQVHTLTEREAQSIHVVHFSLSLLLEVM